MPQRLFHLGTCIPEMVIYMTDVDTVIVADALLAERGGLPFFNGTLILEPNDLRPLVLGYFILLSVRGTMNASGHRPHVNPTQRSGR